jgi:hypothetical protein
MPTGRSATGASAALSRREDLPGEVLASPGQCGFGHGDDRAPVVGPQAGGDRGEARQAPVRDVQVGDALQACKLTLFPATYDDVKASCTWDTGPCSR